jgi:hypothetical protein
MLAPNEDIETSSTFGANRFAGFNEPKRQKFAEMEGLDAHGQSAALRK